MKELQVGDKISFFRRGNVISIKKINRVTKTMAICGFFRFKRLPQNDGYLKEVGSYDCNRTLCKVFEPEHQEKYDLFKKIIELQEYEYQITQNLRIFINNCDSITIDDLNYTLYMIKEFNQKIIEKNKELSLLTNP